MGTKILVLKENTDIQEEHQCKSKTEIVKEIIKVLQYQDLTIYDAREILRAAEKTLYKQKVM